MSTDWACPVCGNTTRSVIQCAIECRARNEAAAEAAAAKCAHAFRKNPYSAADACSLCGETEIAHTHTSTLENSK